MDKRTLEEMMRDLSGRLSTPEEIGGETEGLMMRIRVIPEPFEEELNELPLHP